MSNTVPLTAAVLCDRFCLLDLCVIVSFMIRMYVTAANEYIYMIGNIVHNLYLLVHQKKRIERTR
jgi:hypothetical protein